MVRRRFRGHIALLGLAGFLTCSVGPALFFAHVDGDAAQYQRQREHGDTQDKGAFVGAGLVVEQADGRVGEGADHAVADHHDGPDVGVVLAAHGVAGHQRRLHRVHAAAQAHQQAGRQQKSGVGDSQDHAAQAGAHEHHAPEHAGLDAEAVVDRAQQKAAQHRAHADAGGGDRAELQRFAQLHGGEGGHIAGHTGADAVAQAGEPGQVEQRLFEGLLAGEAPLALSMGRGVVCRVGLVGTVGGAAHLLRGFHKFADKRHRDDSPAHSEDKVGVAPAKSGDELGREQVADDGAGAAKRGGDAQGHAGLFLKPHIDDDGQRHQHREGRAHTDHHPREIEAVDGAVGAHEEHAQVL